MSYFSARVGLCPVSETGTNEQESGTKGQMPSDRGRKPPYFTGQVGPRSYTSQGHDPETSQSKIEEPKPDMACPLCRGALRREGGLYHCTGRCGARWLEEAPGHLVDIAALPFGICTCCAGPQALVPGEAGAVCPGTGRQYLLLPEGPVPRDVGAPHGLCQCCIPPMPLVQWDEGLVCRGKPHNRYELVGDRVRLISKPTGNPTLAETLEAIDSALSQNSARLTMYGLFDVEQKTHKTRR